ncbi:MAG TPA: HepT-like ribonuclease domain-containing protein [Candidatus Lokiarchaeia archaeon]
MINTTRLREKFLFSKKYMSKLNDIILEPSENLKTDLDLQLKAERIFEILSHIILDTCTHIIAHSKEPPPETYADCIKKLERIGIISAHTTEKVISLVKMRNIVVHQYGKINYDLLFKGLSELHQYFPQYQNEILIWISNQEKEEDKIKNNQK